MKVSLYRFVIRPLFIATVFIPAALLLAMEYATKAAVKGFDWLLEKFDSYAYSLRRAELAKLQELIDRHEANLEADVEERVNRFREAVLASKEAERTALLRKVEAALKV